MKTHAESCKEWREKNRYYKEVEKARSRKNRKLKQLDMAKVREQTKARVEKFRARKKALAVANDNSSPYGSQRAQAKAINRYVFNYNVMKG
jgi:hypothetical protein